MIRVYWTRAIAPGSGERHFISPLRFREPVWLNKDIDYKDFLGPELLHCPGIVEEMTKTVVIKSPVTVDLEYADDQYLKIHRQDPQFGQIFFGQPQGKNGIHQLGFGYIFFADKPLIRSYVTQTLVTFTRWMLQSSWPNTEFAGSCGCEACNRLRRED